MNADYWNQRYEKGDTPWDAGKATRPICEYFETVTNKAARILIPGCGMAHEAAYLHQRGFTEVHLCDWAEKPLSEFARQQPSFPKEKLHHQDFFKLEGSFDYIVEQTFFCALLPEQRPNYVRQLTQLLSEGGRLVGLMFGRDFEGGPPFGGTAEEYRRLFCPYFDIHQLQPCDNSIAPRQGSELFVEMQLLGGR